VKPERRSKATLDFFAEMRAFAKAFPDVPSKQILQMATINGARALGMSGQIGELSAGALADVISIPFSGKPAAAYDAILAHTGLVSSSMIAGKWVFGPGEAS
jgi:cytosine/adenosine deaminase-related metal-dependent hydrolase